MSYAHVDEPEKPRGKEVRWLIFVMKLLRPTVQSWWPCALGLEQIAKSSPVLDWEAIAPPIV
jgi:hypothetical protein